MPADVLQLHPLLSHHLVNTLGWRELRPLQKSAIPEVLSGKHALILAPTAGGKTEAAVFPLISRMLQEDWEDTCILYLCPLKALLNNLENRIAAYFEMVGYRSALWHGDVNTSMRRQIKKGPPACLLTTPESLESMLVSSNRENRDVLKNVRAVVIDEIHAFAGDDRGTHLLCLLERLKHLVSHPIQRIGLSATVGNPDELLKWLTCGGSENLQSVVAVAPASLESEVRLDYVGNLENASVLISRLFQGEKRLVFCDSRRRVEELTQLLRLKGVDAYASHSSLSAENRKISENAFAEGANCVIVATSTLELGIDVGDLDRVIQIDAPGSVASFLQRIGRTGRRKGSARNCLFLATTPDSLLKAAAVISLWGKGYVEPVKHPKTPYHLVAHQAFTICLQKGKLSKVEFVEELVNVPGISEITQEDFESLQEFMINMGFFVEDGPFLLLGPEAEKEFGRRHFQSLLSVFSTSDSLGVFEGQKCIGFVDWFSLSVPDGKARKPLVLGGCSWKIVSIDWSTKKVQVVRSEEGGNTRWHGSALGLSFVLAQEIREILNSSGSSSLWTQRALDEIEFQRGELRDISSKEVRYIIRSTEREIVVPTFYGSVVNKLLALVVEERSNRKVISDDFVVRVTQTTNINDLDFLQNEDLLDDLQNLVACESSLLESLKFSACLPPILAAKSLLGKNSELWKLKTTRLPNI